MLFGVAIVGGIMRGAYASKVDDHMGKVLVRACPTCGAKASEPCVMKSGRKVTRVTGVHSARFGINRFGLKKIAG